VSATEEEAAAWAAKWWEGYSQHPLADDLYFLAPERLFELLEPLEDGTPSPVRLLRGSKLLERAERLKRCTSDRSARGTRCRGGRSCPRRRSSALRTCVICPTGTLANLEKRAA
jgi:hypothetical protein